MLPLNWNPGARQVRSFARIWLPLFVVVAGGLLWRRSGSLEAAGAVWAVGGLTSIVCLASAQAARRVFVGLQVVAYPIGMAVSFVGLAVLFYGVITPFALVMRLGGRDLLRLRRREASSHWVVYEQRDDAERAFRQF